MNHVERISKALIAAGPAGVSRAKVVGPLKSGAAYRATSALEKAGLLFYVKGGNGGRAMYFSKPEYAAAHLESRRRELEKQRAAARAEKLSAKPREKWRVLMDVLEASGRDGIERDDLAAKSGVSIKSVRGMVSWARKVTGTTAGMRVIDGREVYFAEQYRPEPSVRTTNLPDKLVACVAATGAEGLLQSDLLVLVSQFSFKRYALKLIQSGRLFKVQSGRGSDRVRYFANADHAKVFQAAHDEQVAEARKVARRKAPKVKRTKSAKVTKPAKVKTPKVLVLPKGKPQVKVVSVEPTNPHNIKPVVRPTPPPRWHVEHVGRHVNPAECRPWAMYA